MIKTLRKLRAGGFQRFLFLYFGGPYFTIVVTLTYLLRFLESSPFTQAYLLQTVLIVLATAIVGSLGLWLLMLLVLRRNA